MQQLVCAQLHSPIASTLPALNSFSPIGVSGTIAFLLSSFFIYFIIRIYLFIYNHTSRLNFTKRQVGQIKPSGCIASQTVEVFGNISASIVGCVTSSPPPPRIVPRCYALLI
jgi:hypothetical protein